MKDKFILDFGCGRGGFLSLINESKISSNIFGIELNKINRERINSSGIKCCKYINELNCKFDIIFLNHVFEHLTDPIMILNDLKKMLNKDGKIIIEIPHGDDFLIKKANLTSFKNFTFWSEHLCLYTSKMIKSILDYCKIDNYHISYFQRYNINNHFFWLKEGKPGGHKKEVLFEGEIIYNYNDYLVKNRISDTLIIMIGINSEVISKQIWKN